MNNNSLWPKRLFSLDISRGLAAMIIVLWHWQHFAYNGDTLPENFDRASQPFYFLLRIFYEKGLISVNYFFLLSGFIFFWLYRSAVENRELSFKGFWIQRISRLYPLHILTLFIVAILQMVYISHMNHSFVYPYNDAYHFILNLGFVSYWGFEKGFSFNGPSWSVSIEILLYLFFFLSVYNRQGRASFCLLNSLVAFTIYLFLPLPTVQGLASFYFGGFVYYTTFLLSSKTGKSKVAIYGATVISWALTIVNFYVLDLGHLIENFGIIGSWLLIIFPIYILFPLTVCSLALFEIDNGPFLKPISWVGDITYSSYMLHFPLQLVFGLAVAYGMLKIDFYLNPASLVIFFIILIPLSYFTFIRFERPMQNKIRNYFLLHPKSSAGIPMDSIQ